jgi:hypothetical protein
MPLKEASAPIRFFHPDIFDSAFVFNVLVLSTINQSHDFPYPSDRTGQGGDFFLCSFFSFSPSLF